MPFPMPPEVAAQIERAPAGSQRFPLFASAVAWDNGSPPQQGAGAPLQRPPAWPTGGTP